MPRRSPSGWLLGAGLLAVGLLWPRRSSDSRALVEVPGHGKTVRLRNDAAAALQQLIAAARQAGIPAPLLLPVSGHRSTKEQESLWQQGLKKHGNPEAAVKWVARPGSSAHETGRAADLWLGEGTGDSAAVSKLRQTPAWKWLTLNARTFGWYPYEAEPWHWEHGAPHGGPYAPEIAAGRREGWLA